MSAPDQFVSKSVLRGLTPIGKLTDEQLDLLVEQSTVEPLFKGQQLVKIGDTEAQHIYLLHGTLLLKDESGKTTEIQAGDALSAQPVAHEFPRRTAVSAKTDCTVLRAKSDFIEKLLCWGQVSRCLLAEIAVDEHYQDDYFWIKKLLESKLFYKVPPTNIRDILDKFTEVSVNAGDKIIQEGDEGSCCYLVKSGVAHVFVAAKGDALVAELGPGSVFGEDALVTNNPRNASIIMHTDGVLMKLEKQDFYTLLRQPAVTMVTPGNVEGFIQTGAVLLDVRTQKEFEQGHYAQAINIPLHLSYLKSSLLDKDKLYITYASSEERSKAAAFLLSSQGFNVYAMQGSINALPEKLAPLFKAQ